MTYEELIIAIANDAARFTESGLKVLLVLVATGIEAGSCRVVLSKQGVADRAGLSREGAARGTRELKDLVTAEGTNGVHTVYTMPEDWFTPQRSLFAVAGNVENRLKLPTFQAGTRQLSRHVPANDPGSTYLDSRQDLPTFQAGPANNLGRSANYPGRTRQLSRQLTTQNQQLTVLGDSIESIEVLPGAPELVHIVDRIARVDRVQNHQREDAQILRERLVDYRLAFHQNTLASKAPDDKIVARCLAIAPIEKLCETLNDMQAAKIQPRPKDAWFVTLLLNKIHDVPPEVTAERFRLHFQKQPPSSESGASFRTDLLQKTTAAAGQMR